MKIRSLVLVIVQVTTIAALCITAPPICNMTVLLAVQAASLALLVWTWIYLSPGKFHILPETIREARLVVKGPYRFIRHPMYLSLLLYLLPLLINYFSWLRLAVLLAFLANMIIKIHYEEQHLKSRFPHYVAYMRSSYRVLPFIY